MTYHVGLHDIEYARYFGCEPEDLTADGVRTVAGRNAPLTVAVTTSGGIVLSSAIPQDRLAEAVAGQRKEALLQQDALQRLVALLPRRSRPWAVGWTNVAFHCTRSTFRPYEGTTAQPVRTDDPFWLKAKEGEREFAQEGRKWHVEAAFAVYQGEERASTAELIDKGHRFFRAVGIGTIPQYRGKGYAKACLSAATSYALSRGLVPLYNTQTCNPASMAVARAVGYQEYVRYMKVT